MYSIQNGNVYWSAEGEVRVIGPFTYTQTERIDDETVADVSYEFEFGISSYVEVSRTTRNEQLPPPTPTLEERTAALEAMMNIIFA